MLLARLVARLPTISTRQHQRSAVLARQVTASAMVSAAPMQCGSVQITRVPCLQDNYAWLIHDAASQLTAVVDPSEYAPVHAELEKRGLKLTHIWNTHHHHDHTGGNLELKAKYPGLVIIGPLADKDRIPGVDQLVGDGETFSWGSNQVHVFDTPGHTRGHITLWAPSMESLFPGDTLFALGCGRLFEGTPQQMWTSLQKVLPLPDETKVFCAHEYTQSNARWAVAVDPSNATLQQRKKTIDTLRGQNLPTVPSLLGEEKATNPFLRPNDPALRAAMGMDASAQDWEVFAKLRNNKDNFRG